MANPKELVHLEGRVLDGRYRLEERLAGSDGFALFRANDEKLHRTVLVEAVAAVEKAPTTSDRRARALGGAKPTDARIVTELELVTDSDLQFIVMPYPTGEPLSARLVRLGRLEPTQAAAIVVLLAEALEILHVGGVAHANLHPA